jgi:hypothetical protein
MRNNPPKVFLSPTELGRLVRTSEATIRRRIHSGELAPDIVIRNGPGRLMYQGFDPRRLAEIEALLK